MQDTWVQILGREDSLEKEMATHSSILAGKSHGQRIRSMKSQKKLTQLTNYTAENNKYPIT